MSGPDELRQVSLDAARRWTFEPTRLRDEPVRMVGTITFAFGT